MSDASTEGAGSAARMIPVHAFTADDLAKVQDAYAAVRRVGNETAISGEWNEYLDRAHHGLGLILAVHAAAFGISQNDAGNIAAATVPVATPAWVPSHPGRARRCTTWPTPTPTTQTTGKIGSRERLHGLAAHRGRLPRSAPALLLAAHRPRLAQDPPSLAIARPGPAAVTAEEFEAAYAARSGVTVEFLHSAGRYAELCSCGEDGCEGWAIGHQQEDALPGAMKRREPARIPGTPVTVPHVDFSQPTGNPLVEARIGYGLMRPPRSRSSLARRRYLMRTLRQRIDAKRAAEGKPSVAESQAAANARRADRAEQLRSQLPARDPAAKAKPVAVLGRSRKMRLWPDGMLTWQGRPYSVAGAHAEASDFRSGLAGRKHTATLTVTLANGQVLVRQQTDTGMVARMVHNEAVRFAAAVNTMAAGRDH